MAKTALTFEIVAKTMKPMPPTERATAATLVTPALAFRALVGECWLGGNCKHTTSTKYKQNEGGTGSTGAGSRLEPSVASQQSIGIYLPTLVVRVTTPPRTLGVEGEAMPGSFPLFTTSTTYKRGGSTSDCRVSETPPTSPDSKAK